MKTRKERLSALAGCVAVAGIGETSYASDYTQMKGANVVRPRTAEEYGILALKDALRDCGIKKDDIDGLVVGPTLSYATVGELAGLNVRWAGQGDAAHAVVLAAMAIHTGLARNVALVYGNDQLTIGRRYGGPDASGGSQHRAYAYYAPWGLTSQGALYALMSQRYMELHGVTEMELGHIAVSQRRWASRNPNAIMKEPLSIEDYASSRYIVAPLHIYDYCLVNDGGTALIVTATESARQFRKQPVVINGFGWSDLNREASNLAPRLLDFYHTAHREVARDVYSMANVGPDDISCIQVYDSFSCHVAFALEGFNFCYPGNGWALTRPDGTTLSVNTSGGHLSESYMQGWNHQVEAVRQVRGEAGGRQVSNCTRVQYICDAAGQVASLIYGRDL